MITVTEWLCSVRNVGGVRGRGLGRVQRPLPSKKEILLYILYRVLHVNAHPQSLCRLEKLFFHFTCFFRVCAYLSTGFAVYRMVLDHKQTFDGTPTPGLPYCLDGTVASAFNSGEYVCGRYVCPTVTNC